MNFEELFKKEGLIIPDYNDHNFYDFINALYSKFGYKTENSKNISDISKLIPDKKHTLFVLMDGMGSNVVENLPSNSIMKNNKKMDLLTVSPSTTGCVLTTLSTAKYPSEHGIIGWFSYNREFNRDYYPVLFMDRKSGKSLLEFNINPDDIYKEKSVIDELNIDTKVLFPDYIVNSVYSKNSAKDGNRIPYKSFEDAFDIIEERIKSVDNTYTYLYIPNIDSISHENGPESQIIMDTLKDFEKKLSKILDNNDLVVLITADHGQIEINHDVIMDFNKYNNYFYAMPGIDFGTATYYIKKDKEEEFLEEFKKDFNDSMFIFKTEEFINRNVFGPNKISEYMKSNLGEYISVCKKGYYLINSLDREEYYGKIKGCHSGFSKEELYIPLIVINN